jgi:hypothetical protein
MVRLDAGSIHSPKDRSRARVPATGHGLQRASVWTSNQFIGRRGFWDRAHLRRAITLSVSLQAATARGEWSGSCNPLVSRAWPDPRGPEIKEDASINR